MTVKNCHLFVSFVYKLSPLQYFSSLRNFFHLRNRSSPQPSPQSTSNLCKKPSADLRSDPEIADTTIDCLGLGISPEVDPTVRICAGCAERLPDARPVLQQLRRERAGGQGRREHVPVLLEDSGRRRKRGG
uniref:(northern house mosquito) hypothetical protein n=1 Tax=Culex pipiens TaxID=7175 RepID=A0A8D8AE07_CULPI